MGGGFSQVVKLRSKCYLTRGSEVDEIWVARGRGVDSNKKRDMVGRGSRRRTNEACYLVRADISAGSVPSILKPRQGCLFY